MGAWMQTDKLKLKIKLSADEIVLLEGHLFGTLDETKTLLQRLLQLCKGRKISSRFDYARVNEDGDEISEQFHVK